MDRLLRYFLISVSLLGASSLAAQTAGESGERKLPTVGALKLGFDVERAELEKPLRELAELYRTQLERLGQQQQESGALEELVAVRAELERLEGKEPALSGTEFPELVRLRSIYEASKAERGQRLAQQMQSLIERQRTLLEAVRTEHTKRGELDEAVRVNEEVERMVALAAEVRESPVSASAGRTSLGPGEAAAARGLKVRVQVDGKSHLHLRRGKVWLDHTRGSFTAPGRHEGEHPTYLNDKTAWMPVWNGKVTEHHEIGFALPEDEGVKVRVRMSGGRGIAEVVQQPAPENDHTVIVELRDENGEGRGFNGSDWIEFRLSW